MSDAMRDQFESHVKAISWYSDDLLLRDISSPDNKGYADERANDLWEAWQESRAVSIELPLSFTTSCRTVVIGRDEIIDALIAQGYSVKE